MTYSIAETQTAFGFDGPQVVEAAMLILPLDAAEKAGGAKPVPVGPACRVCSEAECPARREPSVLGAEAI